MRGVKSMGDEMRVAAIRASVAASHCFLFSVFWLALASPQAQQPSNPATTADNPSSVEVATIKPSKPGDEDDNWNGGRDRVAIENYTLRHLIRAAYDLKSDSQVLGGPDWIGKQGFDIEAKYDDAEVAKIEKMSGPERFHEAQLALRALLADRFQLRISQETQTLPVYALVVAKGGTKLTLSALQLDENGKEKPDAEHSIHSRNGHMTVKAISMSRLADAFVYFPECDRVVVDRTGLSGEYDFKLDWTQDNGHGIPPDAPLPGLFTALREQLGLELRPDKAPIHVVVVESAIKPEFD